MDYTQIAEVLKHLKKYGTITTNEAYGLYGVTRLSSIVLRLRRDHIISTEMKSGSTRNGKPCRYGIYCYWGEKDAKRKDNG